MFKENIINERKKKYLKAYEYYFQKKPPTIK